MTVHRRACEHHRGTRNYFSLLRTTICTPTSWGEAGWEERGDRLIDFCYIKKREDASEDWTRFAFYIDSRRAFDPALLDARRDRRKIDDVIVAVSRRIVDTGECILINSRKPSFRKKKKEEKRERERGRKATDRHRRRVACAASKMQLYAPAIDEFVLFHPIDRNLRSPSRSWIPLHVSVAK